MTSRTFEIRIQSEHKMGSFFARTWVILYSLMRLSNAGKSVDVLTSSSLGVLQDDEILQVLSRNKSDSSENFTFVELISNMRKHTISDIDNAIDVIDDKGAWKIADKSDTQYSNPYYDVFAEKIDMESSRILELVPPYDPGAGHVSPECKRHAEIFHRELAKFTLWALKMYDATAKIPSGLLSGNVNQLGDFDECIEAEEDGEGIQGQYCLVYLQLDVDPSRPDLKRLHRLLHSHYAFRSNVTDVTRTSCATIQYGELGSLHAGILQLSRRRNICSSYYPKVYVTDWSKNFGSRR